MPGVGSNPTGVKLFSIGSFVLLRVPLSPIGGLAKIRSREWYCVLQYLNYKKVLFNRILCKHIPRIIYCFYTTDLPVAILVTHLDVSVPGVHVCQYYEHRAVGGRIHRIADIMRTQPESVLPVVNMTDSKLNPLDTYILALDAFSKMVDIAVHYIQTCQNVNRATSSVAQAAKGQKM